VAIDAASALPAGFVAAAMSAATDGGAGGGFGITDYKTALLLTQQFHNSSIVLMA
jgi:hypothetical protein